jgi:hypothetical protein
MTAAYWDDGTAWIIEQLGGKNLGAPPRASNDPTMRTPATQVPRLIMIDMIALAAFPLSERARRDVTASSKSWATQP